MVKPNHLELEIKETFKEKRGSKYLKNVNSIDEALDFVRHLIPELEQDKIGIHFFNPT